MTNLRRVLRPALRIHGLPTAYIDIVNSQPALLVLLMRQVGDTSAGDGPWHGGARTPSGSARRQIRTHNSQVSQGCTDTLTSSPASRSLLSIYDLTPFSSVEGGDDCASLATKGQLYEHLMAATGLSRKAVKKGLLRDVFGKRGHYASPLEQAFRECFPAVWSFVRWFNRDDHAALLRKLQRVASELVIQRVGRRLQELDCTGCVSLHDAVFCARGDIGTLERAFHEAMESLGVHLKLGTVT